MKIIIFTNTYLPHVGGVARSVSSFEETYRKLGHECLIIAPEFDQQVDDSPNVVRVPALTNFNDSGFSVRIPFTGNISDCIEDFQPDIIHAHHPFLLGDAALRAAYTHDLPLVFTHHTLYEQYTDYLPISGDFMRAAAAELATSYANTCSLVFAPSQSVADLIASRGVETKIEVQPTGIDLHHFENGSGIRFRNNHDIPPSAVLIGHVGRLGGEKNIPFLAEACCNALQKQQDAYWVIVGEGPELDKINEHARAQGVSERVISTGSLQNQDLADAYASFDLFAFASQSETQGLVIAEAMASGTAIVSLAGPGVSDVLKNKHNGCQLPEDASTENFSDALVKLIVDHTLRERYGRAACETAAQFSVEATAHSALQHYKCAIDAHTTRTEITGLDNFDKLIAGLEGEWELLKVKASTLTAAISLGAVEEKAQ